jgi:segregation and condensation protein B
LAANKVSTNMIKTLQERKWVKPLGHKYVPGRPTLYGTTKTFLDYFNLRSLNQLPTLAEIRDLDQYHPELVLESSDVVAQ